jgi:peptidoglycan hydrolase CwlO-like protein
LQVERRLLSLHNKILTMKDNKQTILLIIVIVLSAWNIFTTNSIKTDVKAYKEKIESIQTEVDSAQVVNKEIDKKVSEVKENVVTITKEVEHIDNNLTIVKNNTHEKVTIIDTYSDAELEFFFTNRYNQNIITQ